MLKKFILLMMGVFFAFPALASAQSEIRLGEFEVQLLPEYDQPSMLVICDFSAAADTSFPATVNLRIPSSANLLAVAVNQNGNLLNAAFTGPTKAGEWQTISITVESAARYRVEYYEAMDLSAPDRLFDYVWPGDYAVEKFSLSVAEPLDTTSLTGEPALTKTQASTGATVYQTDAAPLEAGKQFVFTLKYKKTSDRLVDSSQDIQSPPIDQNTEGRVQISNYLPYIIGGLGVALIVGGLAYYFQFSKDQGSSPRRRRRSAREEEGDSETYCHQCGSRTKSGDRFCRVCGTKIRGQE